MPTSIPSMRELLSEFRSETEFAGEVADYCHALDRALRDVLLARSVMHDVGRLSLSIVNSTNGTFTGVEVELWIHGAVGACMWDDELKDERQLPKAPLLYGAKMMMGYPGVLSAADYLSDIQVGPFEPVWAPACEETSEGLHVVVTDEDVRAEGRRLLPDIWMMLGHEALDAVVIRWEATAKEARGRLAGEITIPVADGLVGIQELLADPPEDEE